MAQSRYDAVAVRRYEQNGEEKSSFTNIGVAFPMRDKDGFSLRLHCLPAPENGEYTILLFQPKPKEDQQRDNRQQSGGNYRRQSETSNRDRDLDDDLPF